jgi:hypothetical protein
MSVDSSGELLEYLSFISAGARPGQFFDVRWGARAGQMRRSFVAASSLQGAAQLIRRVGAHADVYVGVALRDGSAHGGKRAISGSRVLYVESDEPRTKKLLASFSCPASLEVNSGSLDHVHLYWRLDDLAAPEEVERANRRLALALAADPASVDIARVLRPPATVNRKHDPPLPVILTAHRGSAVYSLQQIAACLPELPEPPVVSQRRPGVDAGRCGREDRGLLEIPAAVYVRVLAERSPDRAGKVLCPFHAERTPSLQLYPDGTFYCFGRGCKRGGTIFDFAAHLWGIATRGHGFIELRERLLEQLAPESARPT